MNREVGAGEEFSKKVCIISCRWNYRGKGDCSRFLAKELWVRLTELGLEEQNERCGCTISLLVFLPRVVHELVELPAEVGGVVGTKQRAGRGRTEGENMWDPQEMGKGGHARLPQSSVSEMGLKLGDWILANRGKK